MSAEKDSKGQEYLSSQEWQKMGTETFSQRANAYLDRAVNAISGELEGEDRVRVLWLSCTLFFTVGGYWLLRSIKDPIISTIDGVEAIPQAKILSLFVVFALVILYNKLVDVFPKHHVFYMLGLFYACLFTLIAMLLAHPTIGLKNDNEDPTRILGWLSYVSIESFGSIVVQCYWALVNASVDVKFAKKNFGIIVAGAQIGSILGPTVATQAEVIGIPMLYFGGALCMFAMVFAMFLYVQRFGVAETPSSGKESKSGGGIMEGFELFYKHDYVKGIFAVSSLFMIQVTVFDYMMKVLAKQEFEMRHPDDKQAALMAFASFMGFFGQATNTISFMFSLLGTGMVIKRLGLTWTLISFPVLMLGCTVLVWVSPDLWTIVFVMMVVKGMSYALNNPTKEILYQMTSTSIKFKCKSWIDTMGQRGAKATGSLLTNAFASSMVELIRLTHYGNLVGVMINVVLIVVAQYMGRTFEKLSADNMKIGEDNLDQSEVELVAPESEGCGSGDADEEAGDTSCGVEEEGQASPSDALVKESKPKSFRL